MYSQKPRFVPPGESTLAQVTVYALGMGRPDELDARIALRLVHRFTEQVVRAAALPTARAKDVRESCEFQISGNRSLLRLTCTITGSTYEQPWDGSEAAVLALADEAAEGTAHLITRTPHYAWLRSGR